MEPYQTNLTKYHKNVHNSGNFQAKCLKFCMIVCLDNTHIQNYTKPNQTKQNITKMAIAHSIIKLDN